MKRHITLLLIVLVVFLLNACSKVTSPSSPPTANASTLTPRVLEITPTQTSTKEPVEWFSSDQLGLCFSYPQGYTQVPYYDTFEIVAPELPGYDLRGLFWLEKSEAYDRTAEVIADQDLTIAGVVNVESWTLTLDGEPAVVLDGMPGQDLQRRVYVVRQQTLYILAFMPTLSEFAAANDQMEALYTMVTSSWKWSPCSAGK